MTVAFVDTETTPRRGRPPAPWDGRCRVCGLTDGPFYGRDHTCGRCRTKARRAREASPGPARDLALERGRRHARKVHSTRRDRVLAHYGGLCVCCGESEPVFLAIDHKHGGGNEHRRAERISGASGFYRWIEANNYPDDFQILCHNCNYAKSHGGCPHEHHDQ